MNMATLACLPVLFSALTAFGGEIIDHNDLAAVPALPQSTMDQIATKKWFFAHASVGGNITAGLNDLRTANPTRYKLLPTSVTYDSTNLRALAPGITVAGRVYDLNRANPGWSAKLSIFSNSLANGWNAPAIDFVVDKMCYIDQTANATSYLNSMAALQTAYPATTFVYMTMPLESTADSNNVLRNKYNAAVRQYSLLNDRFLLDIADIEAHDPAGNPQTFLWSDGQTYQKLYSGYTTDGGHLNDASAIGRDRVALAWYALAAAATVPEPSSLALLVLTFPFLLKRPCRQERCLRRLVNGIGSPASQAS